MLNKIRTAVFPIAGLGTRFLPITKAIPKEMLPIIDKPLIQYAVEEALAAGIDKFIFVTCSGKHAIEDYFDSNYELESRLEASGKFENLAKVRSIIPDNVCLSYVRQKSPRGLGDAILCAKNLVDDEPFTVLLADDLMISQTKPVLAQMVNAFEQHQQSILAVEHINLSDSEKYGIVTFNEAGCVNEIIEKPSPEKAPSNWGVVGRYILTSDIFDILEKTPLGVGNELQITDAIAAQVAKQRVYAFQYQGKRFDCGNPEGYLQATLAIAKERFSTNVT